MYDGYKNCYSFSALEIGQEFFKNGTMYRKRSSRTAENLFYGGWHYFGTGELCYFDTHVREKDDTSSS